MRSVSKLAVASLLSLTLLATAAHAQAKKASAAVVEPVKTALAALKTPLTEDQKTKTDAAVAEAEKAIDALPAGKTATDEEKAASKTKRQEITKKLRTDIDAVLTAEQKTEYKAALADARKANKPAK